MSDTLETEIADAPRRGRPPRQEAEQGERRRRQPGSLNRMVSSNLGIPDECLDLENYHYHWANDVRGRISQLTIHDDYDRVTMDELEANAQRNRADFKLNREGFGVGNSVSVPVERDGTRAVLLRKRKTFYEHDYEAQVDARQAMMESIVYEGDMEALGGDGKGLDSSEAYVPRGNTLGDAAPRRKGPIPQRRL